MAHLADAASGPRNSLRAHDPFESIHSSFQTVHSFFETANPLLKMPYVPTDCDFNPTYFRADGVSLRTDQIFDVRDSGVFLAEWACVLRLSRPE